MSIVHLLMFSALSVGYAAAPPAPVKTQVSAEQQDYIQKLRTFEKRFKRALNDNDIDSLSLMIHYPLIVNSERGTILIPHTTSFIDRYHEIISSRLHTLIKPEGSLMYSNTSLMLGNGSVWVSLYRGANQQIFPKVTTFNFPDFRDGMQRRYAITYSCQTATEAIIIDEQTEGPPRLRTWTLPNRPPNAPDHTYTEGEEIGEGTQSCFHVGYHFPITKWQAATFWDLADCDNTSEPNQTGEFAIINGENYEDLRPCF